MERRTKRAGKTGRRRRPRKAEARVAYTLLHPVRLDILTILLDRVASANEIAAMLNEPRSTVRRHIQELKDNQMIEVVDERPRRGAMERYYRAIVQPEISGAEAELLPRAANRRHATISLQGIFTEALASLRHNQMDDDEELELSLIRRAFSRRGLEEVNALLAETQERLGAIVERDAPRPKSDLAPVKVVATMFFDQGRPGGMPRDEGPMP